MYHYPSNAQHGSKMTHIHFQCDFMLSDSFFAVTFEIYLFYDWMFQVLFNILFFISGVIISIFHFLLVNKNEQKCLSEWTSWKNKYSKNTLILAFPHYLYQQQTIVSLITIMTSHYLSFFPINSSVDIFYCGQQLAIVYSIWVGYFNVISLKSLHSIYHFLT